MVECPELNSFTPRFKFPQGTQSCPFQPGLSILRSLDSLLIGVLYGILHWHLPPHGTPVRCAERGDDRRQPVKSRQSVDCRRADWAILRSLSRGFGSFISWRCAIRLDVRHEEHMAKLEIAQPIGFRKSCDLS